MMALNICSIHFAQAHLWSGHMVGACPYALAPRTCQFLETLNVTHSWFQLCVKGIEHQLRDKFTIKHKNDTHMCSPLKWWRKKTYKSYAVYNMHMKERCKKILLISQFLYFWNDNRCNGQTSANLQEYSYLMVSWKVHLF